RMSLVVARLRFRHSPFRYRTFAPSGGGHRRASRIHHLDLYSIQMLANQATIIYSNRGMERKQPAKRACRWVPDRGYFLPAKCGPPPFSRRIVFPNRATQIGHLPSAAVARWKLGREGSPEWSKGY